MPGPWALAVFHYQPQILGASRSSRRNLKTKKVFCNCVPPDRQYKHRSWAGLHQNAFGYSLHNGLDNPLNIYE